MWWWRIFCKKYGIKLEDSANTIVVKSKTAELKYVACVLLATTKLDTNKTIRKKLSTHKVSFASIEESEKLTNMQIGGITPIELPKNLPLWIDSRVIQRKIIVLGGSGFLGSNIIKSLQKQSKISQIDLDYLDLRLRC